MRNVNLTIYLAVIFAMLLLGCGSTSEKTEDSIAEEKEEKAEKEAEKNANLLEGKATITIGEKTLEPDMFLKNKTEVTLMDEKFGVRFTLPENDKFISIVFTGPDVYGQTPQSFTLTPTKGENSAVVMFMGFINEEARTGNLSLTEGTLTLKNFDVETLDFEVVFEGSGQYREMNNGQYSVENIGNISGTIELQFDNKVDVRKN